MNSIKTLLISLFCLLFLQACQHSFSGSQKAQEAADLSAGKEYFVTKNYQSAFKTLYPLAKEGNAEAQYAIGYMYYYGEGVNKDTLVAKKWIKKSAVQNYQLAEQALTLMGDPASEAASVDKQKLGNNEQVEVEVEVTKSEAPKQFEQPKEEENTIAQEPQLIVPEPTVENQAQPTLQKQVQAPLQMKSSNNKNKGSEFFIQLSGAHNKFWSDAFVHERHLQNQATVIRSNFANEDWYVVAYGSYPSREAAKQAMQNLPNEILVQQPWVRSFAEV